MNDHISEFKQQNDSQTYAVLLWVGTALLSLAPLFVFVPALVLFLTKKDDDFLLHHSREALNWSITFLLIEAACLVFTVVTLGLGGFVFLLAGILHVVFCVMAAVNTSKGVRYYLPFNLRLIK
ncbi:DUF4870 domain-containing protein [Chitinimonas lacunae]|uniref:DUF4870 domain-containing protein n=1 Tax=Chitinimonas lacunae TaxID=1963018 RepID=A0ABV8MWF2_9NEIS